MLRKLTDVGLAQTKPPRLSEDIVAISALAQHGYYPSETAGGKKKGFG